MDSRDASGHANGTDGGADSTASVPFLKRLAIQLSRSLNTLNPNEVLAKTVYNLSREHDLASFTKAIGAFGRFSSQQAQDVYDMCEQQSTIDEAFNAPGTMGGFRIVDQDVLEPDEPRFRPGLSMGTGGADDSGDGDKHVFKRPDRPMTSMLGLDKLAAEKRKERGLLSDKPTVKRIKYDDEDEGMDAEGFKSKPYCEISDSVQG